MSYSDNQIIDKIDGLRLSGGTKERLRATLEAVKHSIENDIEGDFVECGVWKGGQAILAAMVIDRYKSDKRVWLFDTFSGMVEPTDKDFKLDEAKTSAQEIASKRQRWCFCARREVENNFRRVGTSAQTIYVQGDVCVTLNQPDNLPDKISTLRLDTDFYESTKKELEVLYPRISRGGRLLVDDYGSWAGSKKAVDEYMNSLNKRPVMIKTDKSGVEFHDIQHD